MRERYTTLRDVMDLGYEMLLNDADIFWVTSTLHITEQCASNSITNVRVDVLDDLQSDADLVAQLDTAGDGEWGQLCGGFVLHKVRPGT